MQDFYDMLVHYQSSARLRHFELEELAVYLESHGFGGKCTTVVTREAFIVAFLGRYESRLLH